MKRIGIVFTSMSGNTEEIAVILEKYITDKGLYITKNNLMFESFQIKSLLSYDGILIGTYTYGTGDLPYEFEELYDGLDSINWSEKIVGVFGSGDQSYENFCGAVDQMAERLSSLGAHILKPIIKVDLDPKEEDVLQCQELARNFCEALGK